MVTLLNAKPAGDYLDILLTVLTLSNNKKLAKIGDLLQLKSDVKHE